MTSFKSNAIETEEDDSTISAGSSSQRDNSTSDFIKANTSTNVIEDEDAFLIGGRRFMKSHTLHLDRQSVNSSMPENTPLLTAAIDETDVYGERFDRRGSNAQRYMGMDGHQNKTSFMSHKSK